MGERTPEQMERLKILRDGLKTVVPEHLHMDVFTGVLLDGEEPKYGRTRSVSCGTLAEAGGFRCPGVEVDSGLAVKESGGLYSKVHSCSTVACALGHTPMFFPLEYGWNEDGGLVDRRTGQCVAWSSLSEFYGYSEFEFGACFMPSAYGLRNPTPIQVARKMTEVFGLPD